MVEVDARSTDVSSAAVTNACGQMAEALTSEIECRNPFEFGQRTPLPAKTNTVNDEAGKEIVLTRMVGCPYRHL